MCIRDSHIAVLPLGRLSRYGNVLLVEVSTEVGVHLFKALIVLCYGNIELLDPMTKVYAHYWLDTILRCEPDKIEAARGVIDICQCYALIALIYCQL